jgi:hypothetical protein
MAGKKVKSLDSDSLHQLLQEHGTVYIRWSKSPYADARRGYSLNHASKSAEAGLSVMPLHLSDLQTGGDTELSFYAFDYAFAGPVASIWTGEVVGRGGDNEPLLSNPELLGTLDKSYLAELWELRNKARGVDLPNPF